MESWWEWLNDPAMPLSSLAPRARNWGTCAVGEARKIKPGVVVATRGIPIDKKLERLGLKFYGAVRSENRPRAKQLYLMIERRLIRMMRDSM